MSELRLRQEHVSDLAFDQLLGASAEPAQRAGIEAHLAGCMRCSLRYDALVAQREGFLARVPSWQAMREQQAGVRRRKLRPWLWGGGAALAASVALGVGLGLGLGAGVQPLGVRSKGGPRIGAYVKHGEQVERADDGSVVRPGDYVRFTYSSDEPVHFALLNRDARRTTTYFPQSAETEAMAAGHDVALDFSIKLDGEPGREQVHALFCRRPQALEPLRAALQATGRLPSLPDCRVDVLTLEKKLE